MQFTVLINQTKALEWGLNAQQAMLFAFLHNAPAWATPVGIGSLTFYHMSKQKICDELPLLTDKPDTAYRLLRQLAEAGVIELTTHGIRTMFRITKRGESWNKTRKTRNLGKKSDVSVGNISELQDVNPSTSEKYPRSKSGPSGASENSGSQFDGKANLGKISEDAAGKKFAQTSEKFPSNLGEKSEQPRKNFRQTSDIFPTDHITSNQVTSDQLTTSKKQQPSAGAPGLCDRKAMFDQLWSDWPSGMGQKGSRANAERAFLKLRPSPELYAEIRRALAAQAADKQARAAEGQFAEHFPHVERWLRDKRWTDEIDHFTVVGSHQQAGAPRKSVAVNRSAGAVTHAGTGTIERITDRTWAEADPWPTA